MTAASVFRDRVLALSPLMFNTADYSVAKDGSNRVSDWSSQATAGGVWNQGTAGYKPLFVDGVNPFIRFDRTRPDWLTGPVVPLGTSPYSMMLIFKNNDFPIVGNYTSIFWDGIYGTDGIGYINYTNALNDYRSAIHQVAVMAYVNLACNSTNVEAHFVRHTGTRIYARNAGTNYLATLAAQTLPPTTRSVIGAWSSAGSAPTSMNLYAIAVFNRVLNQTEMIALRVAISDRYGLENFGKVDVQDGAGNSSLRVSSILDVEASPLAFTNVVGCTVARNSVAKTAVAGWNAGVSSAKSITGEGSVSFTAGLAGGYIFLAGLSNVDPNQSYTHIKYGIAINNSGLNTFDIYEMGAAKSTLNPCAFGDVFRISVSSAGAVTYYQNDVLIYPSLTTNTGPLIFDCAIHSQGGAIANIVMAGLPTVTAFTSNVEIIPKPSETFIAGVNALSPLMLSTADAGYSIDPTTNRLYALANQASAGGSWNQVTTGQQPLYVPGSQPLVRFDRTRGDYLLGPVVNTTGDYTIAVFYKSNIPTDAVNNHRIFQNGDGTGALGTGFALFNYAGGTVNIWHYPVGSTATVTTSTQLKRSLILRRVGVNLTPRVDGVDLAVVGTLGVMDAPITASAINCNITGNVSTCHAMDFYYMAIFNRSLSDADTRTLATLINKRYGVPA